VVLKSVPNLRHVVRSRHCSLSVTTSPATRNHMRTRELAISLIGDALGQLFGPCRRTSTFLTAIELMCAMRLGATNARQR
jgi:hypothetical protein